MSRYGQNLAVPPPCHVGEQTPLNSKGNPDNDKFHQRHDYHIYQNYDYDPPQNKSAISEEQTPLQRTRPPELRNTGHDPNDYDDVTPSPELPRRTMSFGHGNQTSDVHKNGLMKVASSNTSTPTPPVPRRNKRDNGDATPQSRWSSSISQRLSSVINNPFMYVHSNTDFSDRTRNNYKYETCAITSDDNNISSIQNLRENNTCFEQERRKKSYTCRKMCCLIVVPSIILSLIVISICSLFIYFHMIQVKPIVYVAILSSKDKRMFYSFFSFCRV